MTVRPGTARAGRVLPLPGVGRRQSLPVIGNRFGGKDHTTVLHGCRTIDALIAVDVIDAETGNARPNTKFDPDLAGDVAKLRAELEALL